MQPHNHTQQMHLNLLKKSKITSKMQKYELKKHSNTKKPIMMQNTNRCNPKQATQCSFQPKTLQFKAQETGHPLCWPLLCYSQDRSLILRIKLTFKSSSSSCLLCLPAEALASVTGSAMAFGRQHSTTMMIEANSQKENKKN